MKNIDVYITKAVELLITYAPKVILAIITLIVGLWLIGLITRVTRKSMEKTKADKTLIPFITNLVAWLLKVLLFISVASMVGVATTSFIAVLVPPAWQLVWRYRAAWATLPGVSCS